MRRGFWDRQVVNVAGWWKKICGEGLFWKRFWPEFNNFSTQFNQKWILAMLIRKKWRFLSEQQWNWLWNIPINFSPCVTEGLLWNCHRLMFSKYYEKILQNHIRQRFREASNKLTTALINLKRIRNRAEKKNEEKKGENIKGEAFTTEGMLASRKTNFKRAGWRGVLRFKQKQKALKSQARTRALLINRTRRLSKC